LIDLIVVMALIGIMAGISALALRHFEAPLETAGDLVDGLIKQTRAKSMASTTVHRIRAVAGDHLVVEYARSCGSAAWTLDPRMDLRLPSGVSLTDTAWSICFDTRGIASDNLILTIDHPQYQARTLEVLKGGTVRWLT
jgi:hypothetical protein